MTIELYNMFFCFLFEYYVLSEMTTACIQCQVKPALARGRFFLLFRLSPGHYVKDSSVEGRNYEQCDVTSCELRKVGLAAFFSSCLDMFWRGSASFYIFGFELRYEQIFSSTFVYFRSNKSCVPRYFLYKIKQISNVLIRCICILCFRMVHNFLGSIMLSELLLSWICCHTNHYFKLHVIFSCSAKE